ncbi:MAG: HAMP domain-containing sensor histidine kinase [Oligoflexia bacterium]|nr:HAMP domain-containing sensor histidine kinase [Oligoflexia bacterium]
MDCVRLTEFYRRMTAWPQSKSELGIAAERVALLLGCPFAAIDIADTREGEPERIAFRFVNNLPASSLAETHADTALLEEMLRAQFLRVEEQFGGETHGPECGIKQLQISRESAPLATVLPCRHLTFVAIPFVPSAGDETEASRGDLGSDPGMIMVGSMKPLTDREQSLLLAAAQKLSGLWIIAHLEAAIQLRSQFLSIASHELKTPLTSIYGILQLQERTMRAKKPTPSPSLSDEDERQAKFLKITIRQVQRLNELIDGLLDVSRIQNGRFMVEPSRTDVAAVLREVVGSRLSLIAHDANVMLNVDAPENLIAWVDPVRIEEVITNLVMNAIRFSPEAGVVWIRLISAGTGTAVDGSAFRLTVRDQGPGVPVEDSERIFRPFERAQRTGRLGGLGLGLYISRQIARLHGGNVSLMESVPGKGNVFEAYFPESKGMQAVKSA